MGRMLALTAIGMAILAVACGGSDGPGGSLDDNAWELSSMPSDTGEMAAPLPDTAITAQFAEADVSGNGGCNRYNGRFTQDGDSIEIGPLASTMRACSDPVDTQEARYLELFQKSVRFEVVGTELTLFDGDDEAHLVYQALEPTQLAGSSWEAISVNNGNEAVVGLIAGTTITAIFDEDGNLSGDGGCNGYSAPVEAGEDRISIGAVVATRLACSDPAGVMEQEQNYFAALENSATWTILDSRLELRDAEGALQANFNPADGG